MRSPCVLVALVILLLAPSASAAMGKEQRILDAYLRQYDREPGTPYCARVAPANDAAPTLNGTNTLMDEHARWHAAHAAAHAHDTLDDNNTYGDDFVMMHRMAIARYDARRVANCDAAVAAWDPATPIPPDFAYAPPDACQPRQSDDPAVPLPSWLTIDGGARRSPLFGATRLCDLPTMNRLGKELDEGADPLPVHDPTGRVPGAAGDNYHDQVHYGVGGDMAPAETSMRDPVFWAWHKYLDGRVRLWETACAHRAPLDPGTSMDGMGDVAMPAPTPVPAPASPAAARDVPDAGPAVALVAIALLALAHRRAHACGEPIPQAATGGSRTIAPRTSGRPPTRRRPRSPSRPAVSYHASRAPRSTRTPSRARRGWRASRACTSPSRRVGPAATSACLRARSSASRCTKGRLEPRDPPRSSTRRSDTFKRRGRLAAKR